jgi:hypothetical protein
MSKDSKYIVEQIKFVDNLLTIFGIQGLSDYDTKLSITVALIED